MHANASDDPEARGPWTMHAAGSDRGREIAQAVQKALAWAMGGRPEPVYPDQSNWVGGGRLAVLRRTKMPAVLLELGFMTNAEDMRRMAEREAAGGEWAGTLREAFEGYRGAIEGGGYRPLCSETAR